MINPKHHRLFGCPVYVLNRALQQNLPHGKWDVRSKVGIYLGSSPIHNRNIALVMDKDTGRVSPQFHIKYDMYFQTVMQNKIPTLWQVTTGFAKVDTDKAQEDINVKPPSKKRKGAKQTLEGDRKSRSTPYKIQRIEQNSE